MGYEGRKYYCSSKKCVSREIFKNRSNSKGVLNIIKDIDGNLTTEKLIRICGNKLKKIIPNLAEELDLRGVYAPTLKQLKSDGYKEFANEIINFSKKISGFNFFKVVDACGLRIKNKWNIYDFDDLGQRLLYDINNISEFNDPNHRYHLPDGYAPQHRWISWISYVFSKRPYSYMDLCSEYGLKLISGKDEFRDRKNYDMDDWFDEYKMCRKILMERGLQNFENDEGMNTEDLSKKCNFCNTFYVGTRRAGIDVFEIGIALGFYPRNPKRSYKNYTINDYVILLREELDSGLRKKLGLYDDEAPRLNSLKHNISWLWAAILRSDFIYTDIVKLAHLNLYLDDEGLRGLMGNYAHEIIESKVIGNTRNIGILSFKEVLPSKIDNLNVIDILLIRFDKDNNYIRELEMQQNVISFPPTIQLICIDITISRDVGYVIEKFYKGYQGLGKYLIVVVFEERFINIQIPLDVKYRDNIKIITIDDFAKFLEPNNVKMYEYFKKLRLLVESIHRFDDEYFRILEDLYRKAKRDLKLLEGRYLIRHSDLEVILKRDGLYNLLKMP